MSKKTQEECNRKYAISINKTWALSKSWKRAAIIWRTFDHVFVLGSFAASMFAIYIAAESSNKESSIIIASAIAGLLTLMGFACNPSKYMTNYRMAFQILNAALVENTDSEGNINNNEYARKQIIDAIICGEKYIGKTYDAFLQSDRENYSENKTNGSESFTEKLDGNNY